MTEFTIDVTGKAKLAGLAAAREAANASLGLAKDQAVEDHPDYVATDADYLDRRVNDVLTSYAKQFGYDTAELDKLKAEVATREAAMAAKGI